jgi:hypothetical protein
MIGCIPVFVRFLPSYLSSWILVSLFLFVVSSRIRFIIDKSCLPGFVRCLKLQIFHRRVLSLCVRSLSPIRLLIYNQIYQRRILSPCCRSLYPIRFHRRLLPPGGRSLSPNRFLVDDYCLLVFVRCLQSNLSYWILVLRCSYVASKNQNLT